MTAFLEVAGEVAAVAFVMIAVPIIIFAVYETVLEKWGHK